MNSQFCAQLTKKQKTLVLGYQEHLLDKDALKMRIT